MKAEFGSMARPRFFILGAPKCGTSTLYELLRRHPDIYLPESKIEPHYFAKDMALHRRHPDIHSYLSLFAGARPDAMVGEASTWYLYSRVAIQNILDFEPAAKCIVMLRNPVDMAQSMHAFNLVKFHEDVQDFETAWSLQGERGAGRRLPRDVVDPAFVQYFEACALADAVERAQRVLPEKQVHFVVFEDFVVDPAASMATIWEFLGVAPVPHDSLPRLNPHRHWRQPWLARLLTQPPRPVQAIYGPTKRIANRLGLRPGRALHRLNEAPVERSSMPKVLRSQLLGAFAENNERLRVLLGHPLDTWRA